MMNRAQFRRQLQVGINTNFGLEYDRWPELWRHFLDVENSDKAFEEDVLLTGFGAAQVKPEGGPVSYDTGSEAWTKRYTHRTVALAFAVTEELVEDNQYGSITAKYGAALGRSMQYTKEVYSADVLNNGFNTSFIGGDGKPLFALDHPQRNGASGVNKLATPADLSETSLEQLLILIGDFTDDRGLPVQCSAKKVIVANANQFNLERILGNPNRPGTADRDINAMYQMGSIMEGGIAIRYLTDPDAWFIKTDCPDGLKHMVRKSVARGMQGDFETGNMRYKARERYSEGWTDWRGAAGSEGGGA